MILEAEVVVKEWSATKYNGQCPSGEVASFLEEFNIFINKAKIFQNNIEHSNTKTKQINGIAKEVFLTCNSL